MLKGAGTVVDKEGATVMVRSPRPLPRPEWIEKLAEEHNRSVPEELTPFDLHKLLMDVQASEASSSRKRKGKLIDLQKTIEELGCEAAFKDGQAEIAEEQNEQLARELER